MVWPSFSFACIAAPCRARVDGCERGIELLMHITDFSNPMHFIIYLCPNVVLSFVVVFFESTF